MKTVEIRCIFGDFDEVIEVVWTQTVDFLCGVVAGRAGAKLGDQFSIVFEGETLRGDMTLENLEGMVLDIIATGSTV